MIIKMNGTKVYEDETGCDFVSYQVGFNCSDVPTPDLSQQLDASDFNNKFDFLMAKLDHMNYTLMSKTELTDYLYRYSNGFMYERFKSAKGAQKDLIEILLSIGHLF